MLSDFPHKYEEYRSHQRERQIAQANAPCLATPVPEESKIEDSKLEKIEFKESKPEPPPEKTRQVSLNNHTFSIRY